MIKKCMWVRVRVRVRVRVLLCSGAENPSTVMTTRPSSFPSREGGRARLKESDSIPSVVSTEALRYPDTEMRV
jgi:hypothetical protein